MDGCWTEQYNGISIRWLDDRDKFKKKKEGRKKGPAQPPLGLTKSITCIADILISVMGSCKPARRERDNREQVLVLFNPHCQGGSQHVLQTWVIQSDEELTVSTILF